ncbi:NAD(P)/FAD-dependent oxidoreductase [Lacicoccus alkaliphilus]|uniref:Sulfide:quinone oxidoreductase n=1 Tax=Lacicoccus alkaliphilus DSM 16010 TaxID=1123231 RepID=A0A1M7ARF2_9BACL|nr:FAD/NAD(P)-binding oxidoreductase [Salinicoccus alkaliphilus]SHL45370.1 sulfide:quinone oxidoreductase [Salinicoccus alkaliphilus DSM 16010]
MKRHFRLIILGGGAGGISTASSILSKKKDLKNEVLIIEPSEYHFFQPGWPLVGSGEMKPESTKKPTEKVIPKGARWMKAFVDSVDPVKREVTAGGTTVSYDFMVVAMGLELDFDSIKGAKAALGKNGVTTNYLYNLTGYTYESLKNTMTGNIVVSRPRSKIKGGVSAENSIFTMDDYIKKHDREANIVFRSGRAEIFEVKKYSDSLKEQLEAKNIDYKLNEELVEVRGEEKEAVFKNHETGERHTVPFEMLVITPPMHGPAALNGSGLLDDGGWVDVDKHTMMHNTYTTVFSLGDAASLPTVKMGAAVREQYKILVDNLIERMEDKDPSHIYEGKTACPVATEYGELILAEFGYDNIPKETTFLDQSDDKKLFYQFKKNMLPFMYWYGLLNGKA